MSDHPCVSRRLRKEKGTFVIIGFVKWKEKTWAQASSISSIISFSIRIYIYILLSLLQLNYYQYLVDEFGENMGGFDLVIVLVVATGKKNLRYCITSSYLSWHVC